MSDPIVSHVASKEYRDHVDDMTCKHPGCKRWRLDERSEFCGKHKLIKIEGMRDWLKPFKERT